MTRTPLERSLFGLDPEVVWIMHCAEGPVPLAALDAVRAFLDREARPWKMRFPDDFVGIPGSARAEAARVIGGHAEDISLTSTTTTGLVTVAQGIDWRAGDEVIAPLGEFPTNAWPWLALAPRGVSFREVPIWDGHRAGAGAFESSAPGEAIASFDPEARLIAAIGPRTRVLTVSWVRFQDGLRLDLARLADACAALGVWLVVDGIQGAGLALPSLSGVAAFASGSQKGLLAPQGQGFLWTSGSFREQLRPPGGWLSLEGATDFSRPSTDFARGWLRDGQRLEQGGYNLMSCVALAGALRTINDAGPEAIRVHVEGLQRALLDRLASSRWASEAARVRGLLDARRLGPIVALRGPTSLLEQGLKRGIHATAREGFLRVAFHGWHDEGDVERVASWLLDV
jgi:selenocysteine lyase/cysteine desulfurase